MQNGRYTLEALTRLNKDANEIRYLSAEGIPNNQVNNGKRPIIVRSIPAGARRVPLLPPTNTKLVPQGFNRLSAERARYVEAVRAALREAGHSDVDARIIAQRWAIETAWDRACQQNNFGNVKGQGTLFCESWAVLVNEQKLWTTNSVAIGVHALVDRASSADYYPSFASPAAYARWYVAFLLNRYGDAIPAARRGGLEGAKAFAAALARGGYSPGSVESHVETMEGYWNASIRYCGAAVWSGLR